MEKQPLLTHKSEDVATIYFNRPEKKNAITLSMWKEFPTILSNLEKDENIKVVVIRGIDDTAFSAGADIKEFITERSNHSNSMEYDQHITNAGDAIESFSKPVIAMIEGPCIGGGSEIALSCDLRFSSVTGVFGITPAKVGLIYGLPQTRRLVQAVGSSRAKDILFSGRFLKAEEAYDIGFIDRVFDENDVVEKTYDYARLLCKRSQVSIRGSKKAVQVSLNHTEENIFEFEEMLYSSYLAPDIQEGVSAFKEKREPQF